MPQLHLIILIFIGNLDIDQAENLVSHLSEKMLQRLEEIEETLLQQAIQLVFEDRSNVLTAYESDIVKKMVTVVLNTSPTLYLNLLTGLCLGTSCYGLEENCRNNHFSQNDRSPKHRKRVYKDDPANSFGSTNAEPKSTAKGVNVNDRDHQIYEQSRTNFGTNYY